MANAIGAVTVVTKNILTNRLDGLDLARFMAFVGMVIVNFKIAMVAESTRDDLLSTFLIALEGRAAATFVVLAGIGLGLAASRSGHREIVSVTLKRAALLLVLGLFNALVFEADILHYYAFYFLFGVFFLRASKEVLVSFILAINMFFIAMVFTLDYDSGWSMASYTYLDFWTPVGFVRNLFFNGWHPVVPWLSFLLFGILLSRFQLDNSTVQARMIYFGALVFIANEFLSVALRNLAIDVAPELVELLGTGPIPPMPLYMVAGLSVSATVIGVCLRVSQWCQDIGILKVIVPAGRQTLTLYIAHILIGMGVLEELGLLGGQSLPTAVSAGLLFCTLAVGYAYFWSKKFKLGPIETVMRKIAG
jgi:uncharacterized membrane protein YeiB